MDTIEAFAKKSDKNAAFKGLTEKGEHPLQCMQVYTEFQGLYESKLTEFLISSRSMQLLSRRRARMRYRAQGTLQTRFS
jgi:hypothetical protein